nr:hypothetical protein [Tanacetum cinerariifolium]
MCIPTFPLLFKSFKTLCLLKYALMRRHNYDITVFFTKRVVTDLDRNLLRLANFPFSFCKSFKHFGDGKLRTAFTLSGHTFNPSAFTLYPRNVPSLIPKEAFERVPKEGLYLPVYFWKHLKGYPQRDSTFQSISGSG